MGILFRSDVNLLDLLPVKCSLVISEDNRMWHKNVSKNLGKVWREGRMRL